MFVAFWLLVAVWGRWLDASEAEGGQSYALTCLLAINALRIGEICRADVDDLSADRWHHTLAIVGKGDKPAVVPLPPRTVHALDQALAGRAEGPLLLTRVGTRMNRPAAARIVGRLARQVGVSKHITPHSLRHSAITAALNAGLPLRDVQEFARHGDPRTTIRCARQVGASWSEIGAALGVTKQAARAMYNQDVRTALEDARSRSGLSDHQAQQLADEPRERRRSHSG